MKEFVVRTHEDVQEFLKYIASLNIIFHPDDDMKEYVDQNDAPLFTPQEAEMLNKAIGNCFAIYGDEVYDIYFELTTGSNA